ncbi:MAG: glucose-6-phosphate isomerase [Halobacteriaceae archaeon]
MHIDIATALDDVATPGVPRAALERLDDRVATAHDTIRAERAAGTFGYAALDPDPPREALAATAERFPDAETLLVVGIGGSALPAGALAAPLVEDLDVRLLDNADPAALDAALDGVDPARTVVNVVSRSGATAETIANFRAVCAAFVDAGVDWTERTVATTGPDGPLRDLAESEGLQTLPAPADVPGRFGVFGAVGLLPLVIESRDVDALLAGARSVADDLSGSLFETPPSAHAAVAYALDARGAGTDVLMPYADQLRAFVEWDAQLLAESLGKDGVGVTPVRARGTTDQHAHLQLYRGGPRDKLVTVLAVADRPDADAVAADDDLAPAYLAGTSLADLQDAARRATTASLANAERPAVTLELESLDEREVGALAAHAVARTLVLGELYDVETFDQPAVEWGKRAMRGLLGDPDCEAEAEDVRSLPSLVVE